MIRIIKKEPSPSVLKEVICRNCGVTLEYVPNDVKKRMVQDYGGASDEYKWLECPSCNHDVPVS